MPSGAWHFGNELRGMIERLKAELRALAAWDSGFLPALPDLN
jgi:hypothetical protein